MENADEKAQELMGTTDQIISAYLKGGCPCLYPRFRSLIDFDHVNYGAGPVLCLESEYLIKKVLEGDEAVFKRDDELTIIDESAVGDIRYFYKCSICGTRYELIWREYSIIFSCSRLILIDPAPPPLGAEAKIPTPVFCGFAGFREDDLEKCRKDYRFAELNTYKKYMLERKVQIN